MKVRINDFSGGIRLDKSEGLTGFNYAVECYNFDVRSGSLSSINNLSKFSLGVITSEFLESVLSGIDFTGGKVFVYKKYNFDTEKNEDKLLLFDSNFAGYYIDLYSDNPTLNSLNIFFTSVPIGINYRLNGEDVIILVSETDHMVVWNGKDLPEIILDAPNIKSMDLHYERLFAVTSGSDDTELKFSDDLDPTNWSESLSDAGFISMVDDRGKLLKVVSFNDYLYVFRENGITRVYANTSLTTSFYVNHLFTAGGRILGDTVSLVGGAVLFLATDGFYLFDGADTKKCLENVFSGINITGKESAAYFNGKYYLACNFKFKDEVVSDGNNALIVVNMSDLSVSIIKYGKVESMAVLTVSGESMLVILNSMSNSKLLKIGEKEKCDNSIALSSVWETALTDFGDFSDKKVIRRLNASLVNPENAKVTIEVVNEYGESESVSTFGSCIEELLLFSGKKFSYKIATENPQVKLLSLIFEIS